MAEEIFKFSGALAPDQHFRLYIERPEDKLVREALAHVGAQCVLVSLIGARQTGKTSLLNWLQAEYCIKESVWIPVNIDLMSLSEFTGEAWYRPFIASCCDQLQKYNVEITIKKYEASCTPLFIPPYSALGWKQFLLLACQYLSGNKKLLFSLDEISSIPRQQWEPFFSNIRAIHQAATATQPEYRKLGMILAGTFVPSHLINEPEKSPFNVSTKAYMSHVQPEKLEPLIQLMVDNGTVMEEGCIDVFHSWTGGLLVHVQRLADRIVKTKRVVITKEKIDILAQKIAFDDPYLSHIIKHLKKDKLLAKKAVEVFEKPIRSDRNSTIIATLEMIGTIKHNSSTNQWSIVNHFCKQVIQNHFIQETEPDIEPTIDSDDDSSKDLALIMKGGGVKGLAYVGALEELEKHYRFNWFVGTSAGAIAAVLLGAGYDLNQLKNLLAEKNFRDFCDAYWYQLPTNLFFRGGLYPAHAFTSWVDRLLAEKLDTAYRVTLGDLPYRVTIYASRIGKEAIVFDSHDPRHVETDAAYAVRCSMSIPGYFVPQRDAGMRVYDGGMRNNYPVKALLGDHPNTEFVGLYLGDEHYRGEEKEGWQISDWLKIWTEASDSSALRLYRDQTVIIDPKPISTVDFGLTDNEKKFLLNAGRAAALKHLFKQGLLTDKEEVKSAQAEAAKVRKPIIEKYKRKKRRRTIIWVVVLLILFVMLIALLLAFVY